MRDGNGYHYEETLQLVHKAVALYDAKAVLSNPSAFKPEEIRTLRDQITSNLERAWEITGGRDQLTATMMKISQVVGREFKMGK